MAPEQTAARWKQRFSNFQKAFSRLDEAVGLSNARALTDLENQGLIQVFEFTHELAWNVLKDYLESNGVFGLIGSRDTSREGFQKGLITGGDHWMEMIESRNQSSHTYNQNVSDAIIQNIRSHYHSCFVDFRKRMDGLLKS